MSKFIGVTIGLMAALAAFAPVLASADAGNGLLSVYVQVPTNDNNTSVTPADFNVQVTGNNPSPTNFWGSLSGTQVSLGAGAYNVVLTNANQTIYGWQPSYSQGCNGTIGAGGTALCIVTVSSSNYDTSYPTPFPYPYQYPQLSCEPSSQTAGLQQNVSFTAVGGSGGTYNWTIPGRNYPNVGPVLTVSFDNTGTQLVTVTNANQTASCVVNVNSTYNLVLPTYPTYPTGPVSPVYPNPSVTIYPTTYPTLPNTGFAPLTAGELALASILLGVAGLLSAPYVRKAFVTVTK